MVAQRFERVAVVVEQLIAAAREQRGPGLRPGDQARLAVRRARALVGHLEEE